LVLLLALSISFISCRETVDKRYRWTNG